MARTGTDIFNADANHDYSNPNNMFWASYNVLGFPIFNKPPYSISSNPFPPPAVKPCASCSDMYVNAQYLQDMSANPIFRIYMYEKGTGNNVQYHTWTSNIKYKDGVVGGNTNGVYFENSNYQKYIGYNNKFNTGNQWWIGWGSPQSEILIYDSFFDAEYPRECLIKSGHNQALNVNSEKVAFQIERSWGNERGDEFVKRQFYIKPRKNITNVTSALGVVKNEKTVTVSWNFPYSSTSGEATHFSVELFDQDNNNTRVYYREVAKSEGALVSNSGSERKFTLNTVNTRDLTPSHNHRLVITPYYKYKGTNYRFTDVYVSVDNFVRFEPRPTGAISITAVSPKIRRDEKNFKIAFTYNNNAPSSGIASKFAVRLFDGNATYTVGEVSNSSYANTTQGTKSYEITANIQGLQISTSSYYTVGITPIYVGKNSNLGGTEKTATNFVQRNPIPQGQVRDLAVKVNDSYVIVPSVELGGTTLDLKWVFDDTPQSDKGVTSGYKLEFTSSGHTTRTYYVQDKSKSINMSDFDFGATYSLTITPYYEIYGDKRYGTSKEYSSYFTRNGGLKNIQRVSPANINPAKWFFGVEAENEYPVFRIAFVLPEDYNYQYMTPQQKASYEYASLVITYTGETSVTKTYTLADNSTEEDPTYICVSGDGHLTHQNSVIIDLTDINIQPATEGTGDDEKKYYEITVTVTSPYETTVSTSYKIYLENFPLVLSDEEGGYPIGSFITAESMNKFIEARNIVSTFTDGSLSALVVAGNIIKYSDLESLVEPINVLYNDTKDWNNIKKYVFPRAIALNGTLTDNIPAYQKAEESSDVYDHIFAISDEMTSLTQLSEVPADYAETYNEYFQQPMSDHPYTFRSMNANNPVVEVGEDLPLFSAPEYNMSWSYYMLYRKLHTSTRFADKYLVQSTKIYNSTDAQTYGGWVSIPDVQLRNDYTYVLDALLTPPSEDRLWTVFGGSYGEIGGVKQGLFVSTNLYDKLKVYANSSGSSTYGTEQDVENGVRKTYAIEGVAGGGTSVASSVNSYSSTNTGGYVAVADKEIYSDYTFVVSLNVKELTFTGRFWTFLGCQTTTKEILYTNYPKGVFIGVNNDYGRVTYKKVGATNEGSAYEVISYVSVASADEGVMKEYTLQGNGEHTQLSSGGFYLMNALNASTGTVVTADYQQADAFYNRAGAIGEIKVYDADNNLIMDFVPETSNGNIGFRDMVDDTFYPANDNSKFLLNSPQKTTNGFMILAPKDYALEDGKILGEYMKIDSLYGDYGRFFGLEIYDENELIHKFVPSSGKCPYIKPINPDEEDSVGGFIPVLTNETNMQLNYGDVFIFDFEPHTEVGYEGSSTGCFIGGSIINDYGAFPYDRYWGIHVGYRYYTSNTTITLAISSYRDNGMWSNYVNKTYVSDTRQIMSFTMQNPSSPTDPLRGQEPRTDGGFFLFGYREFDTGNAQNGYDFVRCLTAKRGGKFYRITVKKADGSLKYDFVPESNGGQVGMRDLVTDTFYPANDSSLFEYGEDDYYGVTDKVTGKFYHCNDNSKFYLLKEGEEPPVLNSLFLGSPTPEETPSDDAEEPTEPSEDE